MSSDALHAANYVREAMRRHTDIDLATKSALLNRGYDNIAHWAEKDPKELIAFAHGIALMLEQESEINDMVEAYNRRTPRRDP